jgi:hypothetical protein
VMSKTNEALDLDWHATGHKHLLTYRLRMKERSLYATNNKMAKMQNFDFVSLRFQGIESGSVFVWALFLGDGSCKCRLYCRQ